MYSTWKLCISKIKRNKSQNISISLIIFLSALLLQTALVIVGNTGDVYLDKHNELAGSHEILEFTEGIHDPYEAAAWWQAQHDVIASEVMKYRTLSGFVHNNKNINAYLYMTDASSYTGRVDRLLFADGFGADTPDKGNIWIPTSLAHRNGISIGDELLFQTDNGAFSLSVAGIVIDLPFCSPFSSSARVWMNESDYNEYIHNAFHSDYYTLSLRYDDYAHSRDYWAAFEEHLATPYLEYVRSFESLSSFYLVINNIIGFAMLFLAVVMMIIAIASIGFTISDDIVSNYKTIGIIKSLGMKPIQPVIAYMIQYALLAGFSAITGIAVSYFLSGTVINSSLAYLKTESTVVNIHFTGTALGVFVSLLLAIIICVFIFAYKTRKILPVQAIKFGASEGKNTQFVKRASRFDKFLNFEHLPVALCLGVRTLRHSFRKNALIVTISALMTAVLVFGFCMLGSVTAIDQTIALWGYDTSDLTVVVENMSDADFNGFKTDLTENAQVKDFSMFTEVSAVIPSEKISGEIVESMSIVLSLANGSYDKIGFTNIEGRNPSNDSEISIGINIANYYGKELGDTLDVYVRGERHCFVITGIYQAIANMAYSGRTCVDYTVKDIVFINLTEGVSANVYANVLNDQYGNLVSATPQDELVNDVFSTATALLIIPLSIIVAVFVLIATVIIYCSCNLRIKKDIKTFGIYKSIGMRASKIRFSISFGILVLESVGALFGLVIGIGLLPRLLGMVLNNYGIANMPLMMNYIGIALVTIIGMLTVNMGSWLSSVKIKRITPRILTVD